MKVIENIALLSALQNANSVFICAHIFPDGDAVGSMLAADSLLRSMGKKTAMALADPVPAKYAFLPGCERILTADQAKASCCGYDLALALDAADAERLGSVKGESVRAPEREPRDGRGGGDGRCSGSAGGCAECGVWLRGGDAAVYGPGRDQARECAVQAGGEDVWESVCRHFQWLEQDCDHHSWDGG